jgi:hypothetical protein
VEQELWHKRYCMKKSGWSESFSNLLASSCILSLIFSMAADSVWSCKEESSCHCIFPFFNCCIHEKEFSKNVQKSETKNLGAKTCIQNTGKS